MKKSPTLCPRNTSSFHPTPECLRGWLVHWKEEFDPNFLESHVAGRPERRDRRK
jgi:hypothetical protein